MRARRLWFGFLGTLTVAGLPAPASAQAVGSEFQVNTYTTQSQEDSSVAADASGNFVVVWDSYGQDGSRGGIFGQRYDTTGGVLGSEFRVNSYTPHGQTNPSVASDASGSFVVVWETERRGSRYGIFGQRYDNAGNTLGTEFRVNSYTEGLMGYPFVASDASGNFVVVWEHHNQDGSNWGIFGQRYDNAGVAQGDEFQVNTYTLFDQQFASVAFDASGNFVVVWESDFQDGDDDGIFGQRFDSEGVAQGAEFRVNSYTPFDQSGPSVAAAPDGDFLVVWSSSFQQDGSSQGIFGQRYDSAGMAQGAEFRVNTYTTSIQGGAHVASDPSGNFLVAWVSLDQDGDNFGIFGQRYDLAGNSLGHEFQINSFTTNPQLQASVAATATNQYIAAWLSEDQDGSGYGVFGQRYDFTAADTITVVSPNTNVRWRIGSLHRIQWAHNLGAGETFRIELDRNNDGTYEELIAAAAPASSDTKGFFAWTVTGPPSATARVGVSWTDDLSVADVSDVTFQIRPASLDGER